MKARCPRLSRWAAELPFFSLAVLQSVGCSLKPDARPKGTGLRPSGSVEIAAFFAAEADAGMVDKVLSGCRMLKEFYLGA